MKLNTRTDKNFTKQKRTKKFIFFARKKKTVPVLFKKNLFGVGPETMRHDKKINHIILSLLGIKGGSRFVFFSKLFSSFLLVEDLFFLFLGRKVDFFVSNRQPKGNEEKLCLRLGRGEVFLQKKQER